MSWAKIHSKLAESQDFAELSSEDPMAALLFLMGLAPAAPWGVLPATPALYRAKVCPLLDVTFKQVETAIARAEARGMVRTYRDRAGKPMLHYPSWDDHQDSRWDRVGAPAYDLPPDYEAPSGLIDELARPLKPNERAPGSRRYREHIAPPEGTPNLPYEPPKTGPAPVEVVDEDGTTPGVVREHSWSTPLIESESATEQDSPDPAAVAAGVVDAATNDDPFADPTPAAGQHLTNLAGSADDAWAPADEPAADKVRTASIAPSTGTSPKRQRASPAPHPPVDDEPKPLTPSQQLAEAAWALYGQDGTPPKQVYAAAGQWVKAQGDKWPVLLEYLIGEDTDLHGADPGTKVASILRSLMTESKRFLWDPDAPGAKRSKGGGKPFCAQADGTREYRDEMSPGFAWMFDQLVSQGKLDPATGLTEGPEQGYCCRDGWYYGSATWPKPTRRIAKC